MKDYYKILDVPINATPEEIKRSYRKLMKENHPDMTKNDRVKEELSKDINEAYSILSNTNKRKEYDRLFLSNTSKSHETVDSSLFDSIINQFENNFINFNNNFTRTLEQEYDEFMEYLKVKDEEFKEFGYSSQRMKNELKNKRGILTKDEISNYKRNIENQLSHLRKISKLFDEFQEKYQKEKQALERQGFTLNGNFDKFLDLKNRVEFTEEELTKTLQELKDIVFAVTKEINIKLKELDKKLSQKGWTFSDILIQKRLRSTNEFTKEDYEEIEEMIKLIEQIEENLKPFNITLSFLLSKMGKTKQEISLRELKIINKNIIENNIGLTAKWKITHMRLDVLENVSTHKK